MDHLLEPHRKELQHMSRQVGAVRCRHSRLPSTRPGTRRALPEINAVRDEYRPSPKTNGHLGKTLLHATDMRLVLMILDRGVRIAEHQAQGSLTIHMIQGHVTVILLDSSFDLTAGQLLTIEHGISHALVAVDDSAVLLTLAWEPERRGIDPESHRT